MPISPEEVVFAYRAFLNRVPESDQQIAAIQHQYSTLNEMRHAFMASAEFASIYNASIYDSDRRPRFAIPIHLMADGPVLEALRAISPTMDRPTSQCCTASQFDEAIYREWATALMLDPTLLNRKYWEWVFVMRALELAGMLAPGRRGLAFGAGREPLPSLMAKRGVEVLATDAPLTSEILQGWSATKQHSNKLFDLWDNTIVDQITFGRQVKFEEADMRAIPAHLRGFDFIWSSCSLEHLGSLRHGADFIVNAMECLRPGGVAVHTTEFNLSSNEQTLESESLSLFRKRDIQEVVARLEAQGHTVAPLNFFPGMSQLDEHIDLPPWHLPHLKLEMASYTITSIGLIIRKSQSDAHHKSERDSRTPYGIPTKDAVPTAMLTDSLGLFSQKVSEQLASHGIIVDERYFLFSDVALVKAEMGNWDQCAIELRDKLAVLLKDTLSEKHDASGFNSFEKDPYVREFVLPGGKKLKVAIINQQSKDWYGADNSIGSFDFVLESERGVFKGCNTFLDLGGHQLVWAAYYALTSHHAIVKSFEPLILNTIIGLFNCLVNGVIDRVDVFPFAVSASTPALGKNDDNKMLVDFMSIPLKTCHLDDHIDGVFDFVKTDIEGYEYELLGDEKFVQLIKGSKSSHFELHLGHLVKRGVSMEDCVNALKSAKLNGIELYSQKEMYEFLRTCDRNGFYSFLIS